MCEIIYVNIGDIYIDVCIQILHIRISHIHYAEQVVEEAPCSTVEEDPEVKRLREQEAEAAAQRLAEAQELQQMEEDEEIRCVSNGWSVCAI
eukprot:COSAG03_NODE_582_length_6866_cov_9.299985_6_plen_92_part_00